MGFKIVINKALNLVKPLPTKKFPKVTTFEFRRKNTYFRRVLMNENSERLNMLKN